MTSGSRLLCAIALAVAAGCVSSPGLRPSTPLPEGKYVETGVAVGGHAGDQTAGGLGAAWGRVSLLDKVDILVGGHGGGAAGFDLLSGRPLDRFGFGGYTFGGSVGLRFRYPVFESLYIGVGGQVQYLEHSYVGYPERFAGASVSMPVAERLYDNLWIYLRPTVSVSLHLYKQSQIPFSGAMESPVGILWQINDWVSIMGEGGYYAPSRGGYASFATALYF